MICEAGISWSCISLTISVKTSVAAMAPSAVKKTFDISKMRDRVIGDMDFRGAAEVFVECVEAASRQKTSGRTGTWCRHPARMERGGES
jgi:hypothetical protein